MLALGLSRRWLVLVSKRSSTNYWVTVLLLLEHRLKFGVYGRRASSQTGWLHEDPMTCGTSEVYPSLDRTIVLAFGRTRHV